MPDEKDEVTRTETVEHWGPDAVMVTREYEKEVPQVRYFRAELEDETVHQPRERPVPCRRCSRPTMAVHAVCRNCAPTTTSTCSRCAPRERK